MAWPERLRLNAWAGGAKGLDGALGAQSGRWSRRSPLLPSMEEHLFPDPPADPRDWADSRVGWGLVLADDEQLPATERSTAADAPQPIQDLLASRPGSPVLRVRPDRSGKLRRYLPDGTFQDLEVASTQFGTEVGQIPRYLLLYGSPSRISWKVQFLLNARFAVGRLDLTDDALENYVTALRADWAGMDADPFKPVVWATDHGSDDITTLMKSAIARPIFDGLRHDESILGGARFLGDTGPATAADLAEALAERAPGLIVTTSHGASGDGTDGPTKEGLGLLIDDEYQSVTLDGLLADWSPAGAIWYAHACCSAGSSAVTVFHGLFDPESDVGRILSSVASLGDQVAAMPTALLGHPRPLRAFIGHVEPTFDWTIAAQDTGQILTAGIRQGTYDNLYQEKPFPVGLAFEDYYKPIGPLSVLKEQLVGRYNSGGLEQDPELLAAQLAARDRMSTVILGDPTVVVHRGGGP